MKNLLFLFISVLFSFNVSSQQLDSILTEFSSQGNWFHDKVEQFQYDNNSNLILKTTLKWYNVLNPAQNLYKDDFTNNTNGQKVEELNYLWNVNTSLWGLNGKYEYSYSPSGKDIDRICSIWSGSNWIKNFKNTNTYDVNDYLIQDFTLYWKSINNVWQWDSAYRTDYINNASGDAEVIHHLYHSTYWDVVTIDSISYLSGNKHVFRRFVSSIPVWRKEIEISYTYDANGYLLSEEKEYWQFASSQTSIKTKINYTRTNLGLILQETHQGFDTTLSAWVDGIRLTYYYPVGTSIAEQQNNMDIKVFPNPAHNELNILSNNDLLSVKITDCQSRLLMSKDFYSKNIQIDISDYASGIYFVYLQRNTHSKVIKFIKD